VPTSSRNSVQRRLFPITPGLIALSIAAALTSCATQPTGGSAASPMLPAATTPAPAVAEAVPEIRPGVLAGYLGRDLPNSLKLLPAPPKEGSTAFKQDQAVSRASQKLRGTARGVQATSDADLSFPHVAGAFSCALRVPVSQEGSPRLYQLLRRTLTDAGLATYAAKDHYKRTRPFVFYKEDTCAPKDEAALRNDGSYPSGHTSIGWMWALVLTQVAPDRADALLARGRSFGESRLVCNAHWQSDILAGRTIASGTFAKLQTNATYQADVAAATQEVQSMRASGKTPDVDCDAEAAALAIPIDGVL